MNIYRIFDKIKEFPQDIKHFSQRAKKGYSYRDVWSIDYWFMEIMPKMLTDLKNNKRGCPAQFTHNEDGTERDFDKGMNEWQSVLERMIFCFREMNDDTCSMKNEFEEEYRRQRDKPNEGKPFRDWFKPHGKDETGEKTYELIFGEVEPELEENFYKRMLEIEAYKNKMKDEGFELFSQYFWNLWD
jgi:hypothetical protein